MGSRLPLVWSVLLPGVLFGVILFAGTDAAQAVADRPQVVRFVAKPANIASGEIQRYHTRSGVRVASTLHALHGIQILEAPPSSHLLENYQRSGLFEFVEPEIYAAPRTTDYSPLISYSATNRVPYASQPATYARDAYQWHVQNTGQASHLYMLSGGSWNDAGSTEPSQTNASLHVMEAWNICSRADGVPVAVIDSGIDYTHPALAGVLPTNSAGGLEGIAIDSPSGGTNGSGDLMDFQGHGTEMAGAIVAQWQAGGVLGIAPGARILIAKTGRFALSEVLVGMDWAISKGARIINCSWGFATESLALQQAFSRARDAGILCVVAVENVARDYDSPMKDYPTHWRKTPTNPNGLDNILAVTSTTANDELYAAAAWGKNTVDLGAPGRVIPTTGINPPHGYVYITGTSVATALTSASAALLMAQYPSENYLQIIERLRASVDILPSLAETTISGGRLNLYNAMTLQRVRVGLTGTNQKKPQFQVTSAVPGTRYTVQHSTDLMSWLEFTSFVATNSAIAFDMDLAGTQQFYRLVRAPDNL